MNLESFHGIKFLQDQLELELERGVWVHLQADEAVGLLPNDGRNLMTQTLQFNNYLGNSTNCCQSYGHHEEVLGCFWCINP